jgi:hypothetical protein
VRKQMWSRVVFIAGVVCAFSNIALAQSLTVSPTQHDFGSVPAFITSASTDFTLSNGTGALVTVSSITSSTSDFAVTNSCVVIPPGFQCHFQIAPKPQSVGVVSANVTVKSNASNGDVVVPVTATGLGGISVSPDSLTYTNIQPNTSSPAQTITIGNGTGVTISPVISLADTTNYSMTTTCGATLANSQSCTISVTFTPKSSGSFPSTVSITETAQSFSKSITLSATAGNPIVLTPSSVVFPDQQVNTTSASIPVKVTNNSGSAVTFAIGQPPGLNFFVTAGTCPGSLASLQSCTVNAFFKPQSVGSFQDSATIISPQLQLSGNGVASSGSTIPLTLGPSPTLASTLLGQNTTGTVTVTNVGSMPVTITAITITGTAPAGVFTTTDNCPIPLPAGTGSSCTITVRFTPNEVKSFTGTLNVYFNTAGSAVNATGSPLTDALTASGLSTGTFSFSKILLPFAAQLVGTTSSAYQAVLSNTTGGTVTINTITASGDFTQTNNCSSTLSTSATCTVNVKFSPTATGTRTGTVSVSSTAGTQTLNLSGTGTTESILFQRPPRTTKPN